MSCLGIGLLICLLRRGSWYEPNMVQINLKHYLRQAEQFSAESSCCSGTFCIITVCHCHHPSSQTPTPQIALLCYQSLLTHGTILAQLSHPVSGEAVCLQY
ncbi:hypothetical protein AMECASPLE_011680 [Ameca splendens]|uniref:Secreted protein n=1 Tax=Ameca splendens TaxID=208324 RepID=A0ABV0Y153_9TELE